MKKILFILKNNNSSMVIYVNNKIKYFEAYDEDNLDDLKNYLDGKIEYNCLERVNEKEVFYYGEEYKVILVNIKGVIEVKEEVFKDISKIENEDINYKDLKLLEAIEVNQFSIRNLKAVKLNNEERKVTIKNMILAIAIGIIVACLFVGRNDVNYFGISVPIVIVVTVISAIYSIGKVKKINYIGVYFLVIGILLSITYGIFTNDTFRIINAFLVPVTIASGLYMINFQDRKFKTLELFYNIIYNFIVGIFNESHFAMIRKIFEEKRFVGLKNKKYKGIVKGLVISIPLLLVLLGLLAASDEIFANIFINVLSDFTNTIFSFSFKNSILKLFIFFIVFIYVYYMLASFKFMVKSKYENNIKKLDKSMVNTILVLINILYLAFTSVQIKYLYIKSGTYNLTPEEYSDYARSGFFQLSIVVLLNIFIIIYFKKRIDNSNVTKILNTLITVLSINMGLASLYKMSMYIGEYGLTQLRFITSIFIIFMLIMLVIIAGSLWQNIDLFKYFILIGSILYLTINFCNMDKIIAKYNLSGNVNKLDLEYISILSLDSYEVVEEAYEEGKLTERQFRRYESQKKKVSKWYEYNYYNNK